MSVRRVGLGVAAGIIGLGVDGVTAIITFPLLLHYLNKDESGLWMIILSLGTLLLLLQCGLGPTLTRYVAQNTILETVTNRKTYPADVPAIRRGAVILVTAIVFLFGLALYLFYISTIPGNIPKGFPLLCIWLLYCLGIVLNISGLSYLFILNGLGIVGVDKLLRAAFSIFGLGLCWATLIFNGNLATIALAFTIQNLGFFLMAKLLLRRLAYYPKSAPDIKDLKAGNTFLKEGAKILLLNISGYVITYFGLFSVQRWFGIDKVPGYTAALKAAALFSAISLLAPQMLYPFIARTVQDANLKQRSRYFVFSIVGGNALYFCLALPFLIFSEQIFSAWIGKSNFPGHSVMVALFLYFALYVNHVAHASPVLALKGNAFTVCAIINGVLVLLLVPVGAKFLGVSGIPIATLLATIVPSLYVVGTAWKTFAPHKHLQISSLLNLKS